MSSPAPLGMFIIGFIIFALYLWGLLTMIVKSHKKQREEFLNDPELKAYYQRFEVNIKDRRKKINRTTKKVHRS
tara:strand:+ start:478 stop:699 length:222 start_codon:yes stop_codon:yes gene_type:complete